jgi:hypothetical protein
MPALSRFISTALQIATRLDLADATREADIAPDSLLFHVGRQPRTVH